MSIVTRSGRSVIAESIALRSIHVAWGTGDGAWVTPPAEASTATALQAEIGRRTATQVAYVVEDEAGDIVLPAGRFSISATPTNMLYVTAQFDFNDAYSSVIRELGIFVGTQVQAGLPAGQRYFTPDQIASPGKLLHLENVAPIYRSPAIRELIRTVIAF